MDDEALNRLADRIDTKSGTDFLARRPLTTEQGKQATSWEDEPKKKSWLGRLVASISPLEVLFVVATLFFVGAVSLASLLIFSGDNTVSTKNVGIAITGPNSVRAGDVVTLQVVITNNNAVAMNLSDMLVEFPAGTRSEADVTVDLPRTRTSLGTIEAGESVNKTVKAVLFGQAGESAEVKVTVEYRVPSSNAVFYSTSVYKAAISQSPASITVEALSEVVSGQATDIVVRVDSNATEMLSGMLLSVDYPPGFQLSSATPEPRAGSTVWDLGDIEPGDSRTITLRGTFTGEDGDDRVIHFTAGTKKKNDPVSIAAPLAATDVTLTVSKPFVSVALVLNNSILSPIAARRGESVKAEVRWANNLPVKVQNVEIEVKIQGSILDKSSVKSGLGFYRSVDSTMLFNKETDSRLVELDPGESGVSTFQFSTMPSGQGTFQSSEISLTAMVSARRPIEGGVPETVTSSAKGRVVVETDLRVASRVARVAGPYPPKVDQKTLYAITWTIDNSSNAIANTTVTATLPSYVTWENQTNGAVSFNESTRTVTWSAGDLAAGQSSNATFQIGITPSIVQVNQRPTLLSDIVLRAFDRFVRGNIERPSGEVTTGTGVSNQEGSVVP